MAELYNPASGTWSSGGTLSFPRVNPTGNLLPNGKVLIAGGAGQAGFLASAELYDPTSHSWTATGSLAHARSLHTAILLPNGKVLVAGGIGSNGAALASAELYDPATGLWTGTGDLVSAHADHNAMLLGSGKVLVEAGLNRTALDPDCTIAELYDPATETWTRTGDLQVPRGQHTASLLPDGSVLIVGGEKGDSQALASTERYDPTTETWTLSGSLITARLMHRATLLRNARLLITGGTDQGAYPNTTELYDTDAPAPARIYSLGREDDGTVSLRASSRLANLPHTIQSSTAPDAASFVFWSTVVTDDNGLLQFSDRSVISLSKHFYRITFP
ncbi:MAG: hypothetical protein M3128_03410 [Verrucomicrobiota bacterium]|nr:hypothetical protein [Verrucomicrobiota bacterium]